MEAKHTAGPWFLVNTCHQMNFADTTICRIKFHGQDTEFFVASKATNHGDVEATAKLIAAAPELLECLKQCYMHLYGGNSMDFEQAIAWSHVDDDFGKKIVSLIKKATV